MWQEFVSKNSGKAKFGQVDIDDKGTHAHLHPSTCIRRTTGLKGTRRGTRTSNEKHKKIIREKVNTTIFHCFFIFFFF